MLEYGLGTPLFNFQDAKSLLLNITLTNLRFESIHTKAAKSYAGAVFPSIISTQLQSISTNGDKIVNFENIEIIDSTYERGTAFFILQGDLVNINTVTVKRIGSFNTLNSPWWNNVHKKTAEGY